MAAASLAVLDYSLNRCSSVKNLEPGPSQVVCVGGGGGFPHEEPGDGYP